MNVVMISPGFPGEMPHFAQGLARMGARVFGLGDQPRAALPARARNAVTAHLHVQDLWDEPAVVDAGHPRQGTMSTAKPMPPCAASSPSAMPPQSC